MRDDIRLKRLLPPAIIIFPLLAIFWTWNWDWLLPLADASASAALGRDVTIQHLHIALGGATTIAATGITVANPPGFPAGAPPLASIDRLLVTVDAADGIEHHTLSLTRVELDHPAANISQLPDGTSNAPPPPASGGSTHRPLTLGALIINNGTAHVTLPRLHTDFNLAIQTRAAPPGDDRFPGGEIVVDAQGTYANAPVTGQLIAGALLPWHVPSPLIRST